MRTKSLWGCKIGTILVASSHLFLRPSTLQAQAIHTLPFSDYPELGCRFGCYPGHQGNDYPTVGQAVYVRASADGVVENASDTNAPNDPSIDPPNSPGNYIVLDHGQHGGIGVKTYYYHLQTGSFEVAVPRRVSRGQILAKSDNSGTSTASHIHFEVRHNREAVDPYNLNNYLWTTTPPSPIVGYYSDGWHNDGTSQAIYNAFNVLRANIGWPFDNGGGIYVHYWQNTYTNPPSIGVWVQDFKQALNRPHYGDDGQTAIILNDRTKQAYLVREGFWGFYKRHEGYRNLGPPREGEYRPNNQRIVPFGTVVARQDFEYGFLAWDGTEGPNAKIWAFNNDGSTKLIHSVTIIVVDSPGGASSPVVVSTRPAGKIVAAGSNTEIWHEGVLLGTTPLALEGYEGFDYGMVARTPGQSDRPFEFTVGSSDLIVQIPTTISTNPPEPGGGLLPSFVSSVEPAPNVFGASVATSIVVTFDRRMDNGQSKTGYMVYPVNTGPGSSLQNTSVWSVGLTRLTINLTQPLQYNTEYQVEMSATPEGGAAQEFQWAFRTEAAPASEGIPPTPPQFNPTTGIATLSDGSIIEFALISISDSHKFYLGKYEVTQSQWRSVMKTIPWEGRERVQVGGDRPAVYISWNDVQEFIRRLNAGSEETIYRLSTEAEWEYAARAGTTTRWFFGDDDGLLGQYAWYNKSRDFYAESVGIKKPSPLGLYDVYGNVWEMVQGLVTRGGSFDWGSLEASSIGRMAIGPNSPGQSTGFRLAREVLESDNLTPLTDWQVPDNIQVNTIAADDSYIYIGGQEKGDGPARDDKGYLRRVRRDNPQSGDEWRTDWAFYRILSGTPWGLLAATWRGLRLSTNGGQSWSAVYQDGAPVYAVAVGGTQRDSVPRIVIGGDNFTVYGSWSQEESHPSGPDLKGLTTKSNVVMKLRHGGNGGDVVVLSRGDGEVLTYIFYNGNTDGGSLNGRLQEGEAYSFILVNDSIVLAAIKKGSGQNVWRGEDYGTSWQRASSGLEAGDEVIGFFIASEKPGVFAYSRQGAIYRSQDAGRTWQKEVAVSQDIPPIQTDQGQYITSALVVDQQIVFGTTKGLRVVSRDILRAGETLNPEADTTDASNESVAGNSGERTGSDGYIRISIVPRGAVSAGAQWRLVGDRVWYDSGNPIPASFGTYEVEFKDVEGWIKPASKTVTIFAGQPELWVDSEPYIPTVITHTLAVTSFNPKSGVSIALGSSVSSVQDSDETPFTHTYAENTAIVLTALSRVGNSAFQKWQLNGDDYSTLATITVRMDADYTMRAVYGVALPAVKRSKIAFALTEYGQRDIYAINEDGSGLERLTNDMYQEQSPIWSPDGRKIAFISDRARLPQSQIYIMDVHDHDIDSSLVGKIDKLKPHGLAWSPDGSQLAFWSSADRDGQDRDDEIYVIDISGSALRQLTDNDDCDDEPSWSPDGTQIVFTRNHRCRENPDIFVMNAGGGGILQCTNDTKSDRAPSWSPDGMQIAFERLESDYDMYVMDADKCGDSLSPPRPVAASTGNDQNPSWSPDGAKIVFAAAGKITTINKDGTDPRELTGIGAFEPHWSPFLPVSQLSTTTIDFGGVRQGSSKAAIFTITNAGGGILSISNITSSNRQFAVSPDSFALVAGMSQSVEVIFTPVSSENQMGKLAITHNASGSSSSVPLLGNSILASVIGDVDGDGEFSSGDAILTLRFAAELQAPDVNQRTAADVNRDGVIDSADAILILRRAAELISDFPQP